MSYVVTINVVNAKVCITGVWFKWMNLMVSEFWLHVRESFMSIEYGSKNYVNRGNFDDDLKDGFIHGRWK